MTAFSDKRSTIINQSIHQLFRRVLNYFECELTQQEVRDMLIPHQHHEILKQAYEILHPNGKSSNHTLTTQVTINGTAKPVEISLNSSSGFEFLVPDDVRTRPYKFAIPSEGTSKAIKWLEQRIEHGIEWGRVLDVFNFLDRQCTTPQQVRFYFPGVVTLLVNSGEDSLEKIGNKLRSARTPATFLMLSREQKEYISQANSTLATAQLFLQSAPPAQPDCRPSTWSVGHEIVNIKSPISTVSVASVL